MNNSNNVKHKGQRDLGGPCRAVGASRFPPPSFSSTASLTLLKSCDFSRDNPLAERCCTVRKHCTKSTRTPVPSSRDSAHLSSRPFSLRVQYSHYPRGAMALLGYHGAVNKVPSMQRLGKSAVPRVMAPWSCSRALRGVESMLFVLEVQILGLVTTGDKCRSWRDNLIQVFLCSLL